MNPVKLFYLLPLAIACTGIIGCQTASAPRPEPAPPTAAAPAPGEYHHPEGGTTPTPEIKHFKGSIGSALGLQMKLVRDADRLTGSYFYQKVGTKIDLKGTIDREGNITLEEFDQAGKQTGVFKGLWKPDEDGLISIAGNWTRPNSDKKTAFSLHEEPIEFSGGGEIVARQIKESNKKLRYEVDADYLQLTGSTNPNVEKFNQEVRNLVIKKVGEFKKDMTDPERQQPDATSIGSDLGVGYTIALARDDLISIRFDIGGYYSGAAHPNSYSQVINFDLKNGKPLKLGDLFKPGAKYAQEISAYCINDLKKQSKARGANGMLDDDTIQRGASADAKNFQSWTITRKGLGINFDSYQVGPYAAGPQYVLVPYSALRDIVRPDGPIAQFAK